MSITSLFGRRKAIYDPFHVDLWDPFNESYNTERIAFSNFSIDWNETPDAHIFKVDMPGMRKEDVKIEIEEHKVLKIIGEKNTEIEENNGGWHRVERSCGKFIRSFQLPENSKVDRMKAKMENGVLTLTVPKLEGLELLQILVCVRKNLRAKRRPLKHLFSTFSTLSGSNGRPDFCRCSCIGIVSLSVLRRMQGFFRTDLGASESEPEKRDRERYE
ncbi:hypothetical protein NE237_024980 [Protea cynaroides]|uniref:SHSP domain-containing protein n=1 Tax=Protea cynaroides TaxID=273540 RepID=A0A9Q0H287_9MAGN|nr:hypothetical protein NE237_024980 [Protea cynaroides]